MNVYLQLHPKRRFMCTDRLVTDCNTNKTQKQSHFQAFPIISLKNEDQKKNKLKKSHSMIHFSHTRHRVACMNTEKRFRRSRQKKKKKKEQKKTKKKKNYETNRNFPVILQHWQEEKDLQSQFLTSLRHQSCVYTESPLSMTECHCAIWERDLQFPLVSRHGNETLLVVRSSNNFVNGNG